MANPISNLGTIPTLTIGGRVFTDLTNLKTVALYVTGTNTGTFRAPGATSGYTPSSSFAFKVNAWRIVSAAGGGQQVVILCRSDNDMGVGGATAATNPLYLHTSTVGLLAPSSAAANPVFEYAVDFTVANAKYLSCAAFTAGYTILMHAYGYEV